MTGPSEIEALEQQVVDAVSGSESLGGGRVPTRIVVLRRHVHRGSLGLALEITSEAGRPRRLFAKTMRSQSSDRHDLDQEGRSHPRLRPVPDPHTRLQYEASALDRVSLMVGQADDPGWFSVDVAAVLRDGRLLVLEHVDRPTLHQAVTGDGRIGRQGVFEGCRNAGRWLRAFHRLDDLGHTATRLTSAVDLRALVDRFVDHLRSTSGWSSRVDDAVTRVRAGLQPSALGLGHGEFGPHNMFIGEAGQIAVFDTRASHRQPIALDLAYFVTMLRFSDLKRSRPALRAPSNRALEEALLAGYGLERRSGRSLIGPYEVLVLLDLWCSTLAATPPRRAVRRAAQAVRRRVRIARFRTAICDASVELDGPTGIPSPAADGVLQAHDR